MSGPRFPEGWSIEGLKKSHPRRKFESGQNEVDEWLKKSAFQSQKKHLTTTKVLLDDQRQIVGYYTLAFSQIDFSDLPAELTKTLPRRHLPVGVLAWLGVDRTFQGRGIGKRLLATSLLDCYEASHSFAFIAVVLDCVNQQAKRFYQQFDFQELPGYPMRLHLPFKLLEVLAKGN
ncbi:MAG: GNAT family N-acetyltransferase [Planctomycetales bacterium]|nr:GNAT family N-acetyltransferase [Planctomycetales bacterium]